MTLLRERPAVRVVSPLSNRARRNPLPQLAMLAWATVTALPLLWAVVSSFKSDDEILNHPWAPPSRLRFDNWSRAWTSADIGRYFLNSVIVVGGALVLTMLLGSLVAYALARYEFRGNRILYLRLRRGDVLPGFPGRWCRCSSSCRSSACSALIRA